MKVLVVGGGGREHAIVWKLARSPEVTKIYAAPGNPGTAAHAENLPIKADDIRALKEFALKESIDLTVIGPEDPLSLGIVDAFEEAGLKAFGPSGKAAELEASKAFCKGIMEKYNIPTAAYGEFTEVTPALDYIREKGAPIVVKADGLAAGKGVFLCFTEEEACSAVKSIMEDKIFGGAGARIVIEELLYGEEASFLAITDGNAVVPLAPAQDHKAVFDGDKGPNTGGMGAYSPAPLVTKELEAEIMDTVMIPAIRGMAAEGRPYKGVLYAGLMISPDGRPVVLEFNCRFGDPETQPILMRLKSDLLNLLMASVEGRLASIELQWYEKAAVCVVMSSRGYPGAYDKGIEIKGIDDAESDSVTVFHAGTATAGDGTLVTSGGRVLGVTALGSDIREAIGTAYEAVAKIHFDGAYHRTDIGKKAIKG